MRILKSVIIALLGIVVLLLLGSLILPSRAHVERTALIAAPPARVFAILDGFRRFNEFSPWAGLDPATRYSYSGPEHGVGARMEWDSEDRNVGHGRQQVTASEPDHRLAIRLEFVGMGTADVGWLLVPEGGGTRVTWTFDLPLGGNPLMRYIGLTVDRSVGQDYERGLARLQKVAAADRP